MTVGVLTTSFPRRASDFAGGFVEDLVRRSLAAGEACDVIAAADHGRDPVTVNEPAAAQAAAIDLGPRGHVIRVAMPAVAPAQRLFFGAGAPEILERSPLVGWLQAAGFWAGLCERIRERAPTWSRIVAHWLVPSALAARAVAPHLPLTAYAHSGDVALLERLPGGSRLGRWLASGIEDLVFVSEDLRQRFARLVGDPGGARPGRVEHLQANARFGAAAIQARGRHDGQEGAGPGLGVEPGFVLSVGRLVPIKGFDVLVRAAAIAATSTPRLLPRLVILGDGPERDRLRALAGRLRVDLRLPGIIPRPEVPRWMAAARLYVQPSRPLANRRTEGMPLATREALAAGLPVVASATGGLAELRDEPGLRLRLLPPGDALALAAALLPGVPEAGAARRVTVVAADGAPAKPATRLRGAAPYK